MKKVSKIVVAKRNRDALYKAQVRELQRKKLIKENRNEETQGT